MMRKNIDKWNHYKKILDDRAQKFISDYEFPDMIYELLPVGNVKDLTITGADYSFYKHDIQTRFSGKKPSREEVACIKRDSEKEIEFTKDYISLKFEYFWGEGRKARSSILYGDLIKGEGRHFIDRELAYKKAEEIQVKKAHEEHLLENGHIRCTYCKKVVPEEEAVEKTMVSRMYDNFKKRFKFCSGQCAAHNQMSLEG